MRVSQGRHEENGQAHTGLGLRDLLPWTPTVVGVLTLIVLLVVAATRFAASPAPAALPPAPTFLPPPVLAPIPLPPGQAAVPISPAPSAASVSTSASARPDKTRPATAPTSPRPSRSTSRPTTAPAPPAGPVSGHYRVMDSYADSFIGEVLIANSAGSDRDWRVELRFPAAVGDLVTSWVEGAPQATLRRSGDSYIWSSGVPVPARSEVPLRFHFRRAGSGNLASSCTVNGTACTGL
ncbi:hypothetical protein DMB66_03840 [Actinoplanes sp. ATCC 53533]|uniref:hypothetical protein n=1 Tax=Actinoplanes sp. ATCC 53533 TaxID=1288362 RepID=UPI000F785B6A|nr:hypothetical protein [Actinoplanes sp. ATCC 53533]RSM73168.1 hypothetical protein DMB66_03840 [Actinoplanes sp. ATCC 53533]